MSMLDWNTYRQQLIVKVGEIAKLSPDTIKGYQALSAAGQKTNLLGPKTRELISLAVAVTVRCDGCIAVHAEAAARHGASREEIAEALGVATAVNAGATLVYSTRVPDAYEQVREASGTSLKLAFDRARFTPASVRTGTRFRPLCVPKTLSELMGRWNRLSWRNDQAALFRSGHAGLAIQVEVAA